MTNGFDNAVSHAPLDALDVLQKVDSFYNTSWQHLLAYTSILIAVVVAVVGIVAVVMPLVKEWLDKRLFDEKMQTLDQKIDAEVRKVAGKLRREIYRSEAVSAGRAFHIQGILAEKVGEPMESLSSFISAANAYLNTDNVGNARICLVAIRDDLLPKLNNVQFDRYKEDQGIDLRGDLRELLQDLRDRDDTGQYADLISTIGRALEHALGRQQPT